MELKKEKIILADQTNWHRWFAQVRTWAIDAKLWDYVDPDNAQPRQIGSEPGIPDREETRRALIRKREAEHAIAVAAWNAAPEAFRGMAPEPPAAPTETEVDLLYYQERKDFQYSHAQWVSLQERLTKLFREIKSSISQSLLDSVIYSDDEYDGNVRTFLIQLRREILPTDSNAVTAAEKEYQRLLNLAKSKSVNPLQWIEEFKSAYKIAVHHRVPDAISATSEEKFLLAIREHIAPTVATIELVNRISTIARGGTADGMPVLIRIIHAHLRAENERKARGLPLILATPYFAGSNNNNSGSKDNLKCPCGKTKHPWKASDCRQVKAALSSTDPKLQRIRDALQEARWKDLKTAVEKKLKGNNPTGASGAGKKDNDPVVVTVIDPLLLSSIEVSALTGAFATPEHAIHPLADSTVYDNCGALHIVNSVSLLEPRSIRAAVGQTVAAGTATFPITHRGTRIIKKALMGPNGALRDLVLTNVAVIEGFHVNIISESELFKKTGLWYCGLDCSIREGSLDSSTKVKTLIRAHNLVFFEYKPCSIYPVFPRSVLVSPAGLVKLDDSAEELLLCILHAMATARRSQKELPDRVDDAWTWHLRAGHLSRDALEHLEAHSRKAKIRGPTRIECEHCARTYARRVVSRRTSENRSERPFWRISWDLVEYPPGYNGANYLLGIKDEYSGKIWVFPLRNKEGRTILEKLSEFELWVRRQFGLSICKIRQDRDTGTLGINADELHEVQTAFVRWAREKGIELEPTPPNTHEPNGGSERAGQEIQDKCVAMLASSGLPEELWPEVTQAAAYLHGMSPRKRNNWMSPNEMLYNWFKQWFRWWAPNISQALSKDLRPSWSGIYAFGCRAYPLDRRRERNEARRDMKVQIRGHLGYLVGYRATNIYRIWVPELKRVITTRNVRFNETEFYTPPTDVTRQIIAEKMHDAEELDEHEEVYGSPLLRTLYLLDHTEPVLDSITVAWPPPRDAPSAEERQGATPDLRRNSGVDQQQGIQETSEPTDRSGSEPSSSSDTEYEESREQQPSHEELQEAPLEQHNERETATSNEDEPQDPPKEGGAPEENATTEEQEGSSADEASDEEESFKEEDSSEDERSESSPPPEPPTTALDHGLPTPTPSELLERTARSSNGSSSASEVESKDAAEGARASSPSPSLSELSELPNEMFQSAEFGEATSGTAGGPAPLGGEAPQEDPDDDAALLEEQLRHAMEQQALSQSSQQPSGASQPQLEHPAPSSELVSTSDTERRSRRVHKLPVEYEFKDKLAMMVLATLVARSKVRLHSAWSAMRHTFFAGVREELLEREGPLKTFWAVLTAAIDQRSAGRIGAAPSRGHIHRDDLMHLPRSWRDLEKHPLGDRFKRAAREEIQNLINKKTWRKIPRKLAKARPLPLKWVFAYKFDQDGYLTACKARICVRGDLQETSPLDRTYAATLAARSFRSMMAIAAQFDLEVKQLDIKQAFLNASRAGRSVVTCELPDGFKEDGMVVELDKALYGLRDSPLLWYLEFSGTLRELGLIPSKEEPCLFRSEDSRVVIVFYVDDILVFYHSSNEALANRVIRRIRSKYEVHDQGDAQWFLGVRILRDRAARKVWLVHDQYIEKIAKRFKLTDEVSAATPLPGIELVKYAGEAPKARKKEFQELVGSILYTAIMIRPDVAFAAAKLSQFLTNPSPEHVKAAKQAVSYLYGTRFLSIQYGGPGGAYGAQHLVIASDASFADDVDTRRSSQGYLFMLFGGAINWRASRQDTVTTSSTEAELLALAMTGKEAMALQRFFNDIQLELGGVWRIFCDNTQTIRLVIGADERISTKLRHVDIHNLWLRQEHAKGSFEVVYLPTAHMPADGLTKNLPRYKFERFRALLNLQDTFPIIMQREHEKTARTAPLREQELPTTTTN
ncbi:hypothetical protein VTJ04DRAFT_2858 [Mycothermus thermophilus]|uniref:uncharacterized protein n=1 Tax=Humicola insolens TaxID=85995 RepID=UPI0037421299